MQRASAQRVLAGTGNGHSQSQRTTGVPSGGHPMSTSTSSTSTSTTTPGAPSYASASSSSTPTAASTSAASSRPISMASTRAAGTSSGSVPGHLSMSMSSHMSHMAGSAASSSVTLASSSTSTAGPASRHARPRSPGSPPTRTSSFIGDRRQQQTSHVAAIHDFDHRIMPAGASLAHNMYLSFKAGEVIRVHGRDQSGWWDGEVAFEEDGIRKSRRGWFPSNYVRELEWDELLRRPERAAEPAGALRSRRGSYASHGSPTTSHQSHGSSSRLTTPLLEGSLPPALQALLQPVMQTLSLLHSSVSADRRRHITPSAAQVIAAIRQTLLRMDCLSKDSATLAAHPALAQQRRDVLSELSKLVSAAKQAGNEVVRPDDDTSLESTSRAADRVFNSIRSFLQCAGEMGVSVLPLATEGDRTDADPAAASSRRLSRVRAPSGSSSRGSRIPASESMRLKSASVSDLRGAARRQQSNSSPPPPMPNASMSAGPPPAPRFSGRSPSTTSGRSSPGRRRTSRGRHHRSQSFDFEDSAETDIDNTSQSTHGTHSTHQTHVTPMVNPTRATDGEALYEQYSTGRAVHEAITAAEDALLSIIASFIGHIHSHHFDSHPSTHAYLIELTRETVDRVRDLLTIVEVAGQQASLLGMHQREIPTLRSARESLYEAAEQLVESAESVSRTFNQHLGEEAYEAEKAQLLVRTTKTLKAGTECSEVVKRIVPEDNAEPDFDSPDLNMAGVGYSPRKGYAAIGLGIRSGPGSLQSLTRRATSLGQLHRRFNHDGAGRVSMPPAKGEEDEEGEEEIVEDASSSDEEADESTETASATGRRGMRPISHPSQPAIGQVQRRSIDSVQHPRSRSSSLRSSQVLGDRRSIDTTYTGDLKSEESETTAISHRDSVHASVRTSTTSHIASSLLQSASSTGLSEITTTPSLSESGTTQVDSPKDADAKAVARQTPPTPRTAQSFDGSDPSGGDVRFWVVSHDYDPVEVAYNSDGILVGGTLRVLVEKLTPHDGPTDPNFMSTFWYTFRLFSNPTQFLDALIARYDLKPPPALQGVGHEQYHMWVERKLKPVRIRVCNILKVWLDQHWRADSDNAVLDTMEEFFLNRANDQVTPSLTAPGGRVAELVRKRKEPSTTSSESISNASGTKQTSFDRIRNSTFPGRFTTPAVSTMPNSNISKALMNTLMKNPAPTAVSLTDFDTLELARQFCIMESKLFQAIAPEDLLMSGRKQVPALKALSTVSNQIIGWVTDGILNEQDAKHRAALLKFYIKLADKCLSLNNFSTMFAVLGGLNSATILRLKKTWDALNVKYRNVMEKLRAVIDHTKNHRNYRDALRAATAKDEPVLPFLGLILTDITFTQEGNPNTRSSTLNPELQLINTDKYAKLGRIASEFKNYQRTFEFREIECVQTFLQRALTERGSGSLDALYRKSLLLEPRQNSERLNNMVEKPGWLGARLTNL